MIQKLVITTTLSFAGFFVWTRPAAAASLQGPDLFGFFTVHLSPSDMDAVCAGGSITGLIAGPIGVGASLIGGALCTLDRASGHHGVHINGNIAFPFVLFPLPGEN